jgi:hypothetical protein
LGRYRHKDEPGYADAVNAVTKTNPFMLRVYRKGTTDGGKRALDLALWEQLRKHLRQLAADANLALVMNPLDPALKNNVANVLNWDYFKDHGIIVPSSAESKDVILKRITEAVVEGQSFMVDGVNAGPKTIILRVQYPALEIKAPLETRFKAALIQSGIPEDIRRGITWFGVDKVAAATGKKRRLIQFRATEQAARYLVEKLNSKLFFEDECNRVEYENMKLTSLETARFGYHAVPPNQFVHKPSR